MKSAQNAIQAFLNLFSRPSNGAGPLPHRKLTALLDSIYKAEKSSTDESQKIKSLSDYLKDEISCGELTPRTSYQVLLQRLPESSSIPKKYANELEAATHIYECLQCEEFLIKVPELVLNNYDNLERVIFLHIPKTAGSYARESFKNRNDYFVWDKSYELPYKEVQKPSIKDLSELSRARYKSFAITGHYTLSALISRNLIRAGTKGFCAIRDPMAMIVSGLNYILTSITNAPEAAYSKAWQKILEEAGAIGQAGEIKDVLPTCETILFSKTFENEYSNNMTRFLGDNSLESSLENLAISGFDIVRSDYLTEYLGEKFGIPPLSERINESTKYISAIADLGSKAIEYVQEKMIEKDRYLYQHLMSKIEGEGKGFTNLDS